MAVSSETASSCAILVFPPVGDDRRGHFTSFFDDRTYRCLLFATQLLTGVHLFRKGHNPICTWRYGLCDTVSCIIKTCLCKVDFGGCSPASLMIQGLLESLILSWHHDLSRKKIIPTRIQRVWLDIHLPSSFFLPRFCMEDQEGVGLRKSELVFRQGAIVE